MKRRHWPRLCSLNMNKKATTLSARAHAPGSECGNLAFLFIGIVRDGGEPPVAYKIAPLAGFDHPLMMVRLKQVALAVHRHLQAALSVKGLHRLRTQPRLDPT